MNEKCIIAEVEESMHRVLAEQSEKDLRDYFAGLALQGIIANSWLQSGAVTDTQYASDAYNLADAMLKVREE